MANTPNQYDTRENIDRIKASVPAIINQNCRSQRTEYQLWTREGVCLRISDKTNWCVKGQLLRAAAKMLERHQRCFDRNIVTPVYTWRESGLAQDVYLKALKEMINEGTLIIREIQ